MRSSLRSTIALHIFAESAWGPSRGVPIAGLQKADYGSLSTPSWWASLIIVIFAESHGPCHGNNCVKDSSSGPSCMSASVLCSSRRTTSSLLVGYDPDIFFVPMLPAGQFGGSASFFRCQTSTSWQSFSKVQVAFPPRSELKSRTQSPKTSSIA